MDLPVLLESYFETLKADLLLGQASIKSEFAHLHERVDRMEAGFSTIHERFTVLHDKLNTALVAVSHIIEKVNDMSAINELKSDVAELDAEVDQLIAAKAAADANATAADSAAAAEIKSSLDAIKAKVTTALTPSADSVSGAGPDTLTGALGNDSVVSGDVDHI